jgi:hypothetical protein
MVSVRSSEIHNFLLIYALVAIAELFLTLKDLGGLKLLYMYLNYIINTNIGFSPAECSLE